MHRCSFTIGIENLMACKYDKNVQTTEERKSLMTCPPCNAAKPNI